MSLTLDSTGSDMMTSVTFLNDAPTTSSHGAFVYRKHLCRASLNYPQCALALAPGGMRRGKSCWKRQTSSSSPSTSISTPFGVFLTHPIKPSSFAKRATAGRKPTPCTRPLTVIRRPVRLVAGGMPSAPIALLRLGMLPREQLAPLGLQILTPYVDSAAVESRERQNSQIGLDLKRIIRRGIDGEGHIRKKIKLAD